MCNLSEGVELRGYRRGRQEGTVSTLVFLVRDGLLSAEVVDSLHISLRQSLCRIDTEDNKKTQAFGSCRTLFSLQAVKIVIEYLC